MDRFRSKINLIGSLLRAGHFAVVASEIKRWLWSETLYIGLRRDLSQPFETPNAKIHVIVRPMEHADIVNIKAVNGPGISGQERLELSNRLRLLSTKIGTCYVAASSDNYPCYMQWLIGASENDVVQTYFGGVFPKLDPDEALLEGALTLKDFRGMGIMPCAMSQIAEKAVEFRATKAITFVEENNIPSLKGCKRAGFVPYQTRRDQWRLFRRQSVFNLLPHGTPYSFDKA